VKGQASIEAIISFVIFLGFLGLLLGSLAQQSERMEEIADIISEKKEAISCSITLNSLYSNSVEGTGIKFDCKACRINRICCPEKSTGVIPKVKNVKTGNKKKLEAENEAHYR